MDKMGSPRGLIRYTTQHAVDGAPTRLARPRVLIYGALLVLLVGGFILSIAARSSASLDVIRDRKALYQLTDDGYVDNVYTVRILNKSEGARRFMLAAAGSSELTVLPVGRVYDVPGGAIYSVPLRIRRAAYEPLGSETIRLTLVSADDSATLTTTEARFLAPAR
jgi:polyferredoxin